MESSLGKTVLGLLACGAVILFMIGGLNSENPTQDFNIIHIVKKIPVVEARQAASKEVYPGSIRVPILMYHHVGYLPADHDAEAVDLTVSPEDFRQQVLYFKQRGYESITLHQAMLALSGEFNLPPKPIVFTFDDGYADVFLYAEPILVANGFTGSFAIATELLGRPSYAVWPDVVSASQKGMEILSHTENHLDLTNSKYSEEDLKREIDGSRKILNEKLDQEVEFFVYPYGKYNDKVVQMVKDAGYEAALTTGFGVIVNPQNLFRINRVRVHGGSEGLEKLRKVFEPSQVLQTSSVPPNL